MAELPEYARQAIDDLRQSVIRKMNDMTETLQGLNALERNYDLPLTDIGEFVTTVTPPETQVLDSKRESHASKPSNVTILPDTYLGDPPLEAAKKYIWSVGHAVSFDEIVAAVTKGGAATVGPNWRDALEISLMRSGQEVVKVAGKRTDWFASIPRRYDEIASVAATNTIASEKEEIEEHAEGQGLYCQTER